jgi:hypothetical protein
MDEHGIAYQRERSRMTTHQLESALARTIDYGLSFGLTAIDRFGEHPQVQQLGTLLMALALAATFGRSLGIGR